MFDAIFIDQCKYDPVPTHIIQNIIKNESGTNPYTINVNSNGKSLKAYLPKSKEKAEAIAKNWITKGYTVDIGIMQVNSANLMKYNTTVKEMLDPCKNIYVASSIYYDFYKNTPKNDTQLLRTQKALSAYNTGSYIKGFKNGYVGKYFSGAPHSTPKHVKKYAKYLLSIKFPSRLTATLK